MKPDVTIDQLSLPAVYAGKPRKREIMRRGAAEAANAVGALAKGCELFCVTNGQFSMIDVLRHVVETTGPADVCLATWTAADGDLRKAHAFLMEGKIRSIKLIVDPSFRSRKPQFCATLVELFGDEAIRTVPLHGKFCAVRNDAWTFAVRSSMNLNPNRRIETVEISEDPALTDFLFAMTAEIFEAPSAANFTTQSLSRNDRHDVPTGLLF